MTQTTTPPDPLVIDWLLSALYRRLYFSSEMGVLTCLEYPPERFGPFVDGHLARPARALAEVLRLAAAEAGLAAAAKPLEGVALRSEMLAAAMLAMGEFWSMQPQEVREAADRFGGAWHSLRSCLEVAAAAFEARPSFLSRMPAGREHAVRETLLGLSAELEAGRSRPAP
jgi:hypothetical protein